GGWVAQVFGLPGLVLIPLLRVLRNGALLSLWSLTGRPARRAAPRGAGYARCRTSGAASASSSREPRDTARPPSAGVRSRLGATRGSSSDGSPARPRWRR